MTEHPSCDQLRQRLQVLSDRIAQAAIRSGRSPDEITLVGVTKYVDIDTTRQLIELGCLDIGESRPQSLWAKAEHITASDVRWHMIGHLQRNKVKRTIQHADVIHSVDSIRLLESIDREASQLGRKIDCLIEVNISGDESKHGFAPDILDATLTELPRLENAPVVGMMTMASRDGGIAQAEKDFSAFRELRDRLTSNCPSHVSLNELSMGMSGDFEAAIAQGATLVRLGSVLVRPTD